MHSPYPMTPLARLQDSPPQESRSYRAFRTAAEAVPFITKYQKRITSARMCPVSGRYIVRYRGIIRERVCSVTTRVIMSQGIRF